MESYYLGELDAAINQFQEAITLNENDNRPKELLAMANAIRDEKGKGNCYIFKLKQLK